MAADGGIFSYGDAGFFGSAGGIHLNKPIVGMASTARRSGLLAGRLRRRHLHLRRRRLLRLDRLHPLNKPIVGMAPTPDGGGYWLVASDGGIFSYGDAGFFGSTGSIHLNKPIVGMAPTPDGGGYWLVASDGGIFSFGDAHVLRLDRGHPPEQAHRRHGRHARRGRLLVHGVRRRALHLRRRALLRQQRRAGPGPGRGHDHRRAAHGPGRRGHSAASAPPTFRRLRGDHLPAWHATGSTPRAERARSRPRWHPEAGGGPLSAGRWRPRPARR